MILKATAVLLLCCYSQATHLQYQQCILMDLDTNNTLAFTDGDGNVLLDSSLEFDTAMVVGGLCYTPTSSMPEIVLIWTNAAVMTFSFDNTTNGVMLSWQLQYIPKFIFGTTETRIVAHNDSFPAGNTDMAFTCRNQAPVRSEVKMGNNTYTFEMTFTQAKWQAFNIKEGQYNFNDSSQCSADSVDSSGIYSIVPIAVGIVGSTLAGLALAVLILYMYLIGRKRFRRYRNGYGSLYESFEK